MSKICILATGGTIAKDHDPITEDLVFTEKSYIPEMLKRFRADHIQHEVIFLKDSLEITSSDRDIIVESVLKRPEKHIVITHGTSTMAETASYLKGKVEDKTIVLTGAMRPFALFRSDAGFNLGSAITAARLLDPGVFLAMNGRVFNADEVEKDIHKGTFLGKSI